MPCLGFEFRQGVFTKVPPATPYRMLCISCRAKKGFKTFKLKYAAPAPREHRISAHPLVELALVTGVARPSADALRLLAETRRPRLADTAMRQRVQGEPEQMPPEVSREAADGEWLGLFVGAHDPGSIENGLLTPPMTFTRHRIEAAIEVQVDASFARGERSGWA